MPISRRHLLLAGAGLPMIASCASDITRFRDRPVGVVATALNVCAAAYVVLQGGRPADPVQVSGCAGNSAQADAIFQAASLTKPVVACAALRLVLDGRLDLHAPVSRYLPEGYRHFHKVFERSAEDAHDLVPASVLHRITAAQLLSHTAGLPNWSAGPLSTLSEPGQRWVYSGEGYVLLQSVIEAVTGVELSAYLDQHLFAPLGMSDTSLVWRDAFAERAVGGTTVLGVRRPARFRSAVAAASLYTTAADYGKFMAAVLADGRLLSLVLANPVEVDGALGLQWGLGWGIERTREGPCLWQWGNNPGFRAFAMASVASKDGFAIFANSERAMPLAASLAQSVLPTDHGAFRFSRVAS